MNENIDLTKILEGCPKEAVFYSPLCGEVMGIKIFKNHIFAIPSNFLVVCFTFEGRASYYDGEMETFDDATDGECLLFPSKKQKTGLSLKDSGIIQRWRNLTQRHYSLSTKY